MQCPRYILLFTPSQFTTIEMSNNEIDIKLVEKEILPHREVHGIIYINHASRFDSIAINSHIENSSDIFNYTRLDSKKINHKYARLSIFREDLQDKKKIEFTAVTGHKPAGKFTNAKFRVAVVQEHKEIASAIVLVKILGQGS